jgi:hypothetical protein
MPPVRDECGELVCRVFPREVPDVDDVELAVREPLVEKFGFERRHRRISPPGRDLYRCLDLWQEVA